MKIITVLVSSLGSIFFWYAWLEYSFSCSVLVCLSVTLFWLCSSFHVFWFFPHLLVAQLFPSHHKSTKVITSSHKWPQVVTNCLKLSQFVIICHKSPQVNKSHHKLSRVVKCQRKLSKVETICHKLIQFIKRILPSSASTKLEAEIALFSITPATRTHRWKFI